jgi:hypothetical protein
MLYRLEKRPSWALFLTAECSMESGWRMSEAHKLFAKGGIHFRQKTCYNEPDLPRARGAGLSCFALSVSGR